MEKEYGGFKEPDKKELKKSRKAGYVFGAVGGVKGEVINQSGDWTKYWPEPEKQSYTDEKRWVETNACTSYNTNNPQEALLFFKYGVKENHSDRALAIDSGTNPNSGNDPHKVAEAKRKRYLLEQDLPFSDDIKTREQFYSPNPLPPKLIQKAEYNALSRVYNHEWIFTPEDKLTPEEKKAKLKDALKKGTVAVSVKAWKKNDKGLYYKAKGESDNHWTGLMRYDGDNPIVGDSYEPFEKKLTEDYNFGYAKIYYLNAENVQTLTILQRIINAIAQMMPFLTELVREKVEDKDVPIVPDETIPLPVEPAKKEYFWDTPMVAKHSARVIMDEYGLAWKEKDLLCAVIQEESGFNPKAIGKPNSNGTRDYGLCQFNDGKNSKGQAYWIGQGADFASIDEVLTSPEKNVRIMIREYKRGNLKWWSAFSTGAYKKHLT